MSGHSKANVSEVSMQRMYTLQNADNFVSFSRIVETRFTLQGNCPKRIFPKRKIHLKSGRPFSAVNYTDQYLFFRFTLVPSVRLPTLQSHVFRYSSELNSGRCHADLMNTQVEHDESVVKYVRVTNDFVPQKLRSYSAVDTGVILATVKSVWRAETDFASKFFVRPRRMPST